MMQPVEHVETLRDHWWWRPGWRAGRHMYACHLTMDDQPALRRLVARQQETLRDLPGLDLIPPRWLHLSMQEIGFVDIVDDGDVDRVARAIRRHLAGLPPPVVTFHPPVVRREAVYLPASPAGPIAAVRAAVRTAIAETLGPERVEPAGDAAAFRPHVSIAYSNREQAGQPISAALSGVRPGPVTVTFDHADLLRYHRDRRMYEWTTARPLPVGGPDR